jgi:alpha-1,2-mannosyltransferase
MLHRGVARGSRRRIGSGSQKAIELDERARYRARGLLWQRLRPWKWAPLLIGIGWLVIGWIITAASDTHGDFENHRAQAQRLLSGKFIYQNGLDVVYPPFWALVHTPLTLVPTRVARVLLYPLAGLSLALLLWLLDRLTRQGLPLHPEATFWCAVLAVLLTCLFLSRDLPIVGANTALLALCWLGFYLWSRGRPLRAGACLGLASALKCTPLIFVAYFLLKQKWRLSGMAIVVAALATLSPVLVMGPEAYRQTMSAWLGQVMSGLGDPDPSRGPLGEEKVENLSLRPALARYLMHLPYGHLGRPETSDNPDRPNDPPSPYYLQFLDLTPRQAGIVVRVVMAALVLLVFGLFRGKPEPDQEGRLAMEFAAVTVLALLCSPVTWKAHAVGTLPAVYLVVRRALSRGELPLRVSVALGIFAAPALLLNRTFCGRDAIKLVDAYRIKTIGFLGLLAAVLFSWALEGARRRGPEMNPVEETAAGASPASDHSSASGARQ